jgi:hypothetical protein
MPVVSVVDDGVVRIGIFDHFGWAVAVTATDDHEVVDRRRLELVDEGLTQAPIHYDAKDLDDEALASSIAEVAASALRVGGAGLDRLAADVGRPIATFSLRTWPSDFPTEMATLRQSPWEARADAVMYRQVLAVVAEARGWDVRTFDAKTVLDQAAAVLGPRTDEVLVSPKERLGAPWTKDHRIALAATVVATAAP